MYRFNRLSVIRLGLLLAATAIILLVVPRPDHQSFSYELNQPWKYPLLTAEFDMPILRDSASANALRDSIDRHFIPFVKRDTKVADNNTERFSKALAAHVSVGETTLLTGLLKAAYSRGIVSTEVYDIIRNHPQPRLRISSVENGGNAVRNIDASEMLSPRKAFEFIDSAYTARKAGTGEEKLSPEVVRTLNICLNPNIVVDTVSDQKFRNQEYLNVNGAMGVIKKGQRIVDRGEIVTPQIFTNLNTYQEIMQRQQGESQSHTYFAIGQGLYIIVCFCMLYLYMMIYRPGFFSDLRKMIFLVSFITLIVIFAILMFEWTVAGIYFVPFAAVPVTIMVFFDSRTAIFSLLTSVLIASIVATFPFNFLFLEFIAGLVATLSLHQLSKRSQLLRTALFTFLAYVGGTVILCLLLEGNLEGFSWKLCGIFAVNSVILSFAYILILIIEKVFGFTSTVTLVELSDINSPLLRRLAEEAPGTFQHSMQVSTLAAEAARAIEANTTLVRTGALYHDIGKMESPIFFTENQHGVNPHAGLNPETSAQKIISHVTEGLQLASKAKLPAVIKSFISEHHGRGITKYFYNTAVNESPEGTVVDKENFTYPGPNPQSKETAILMMADAVEAASRSLKEYTHEAINNLVDRIIDSQIADGLLKEAPISFKDVETVKSTFKKRLATIYHSRVAYPEIHRQHSPEKDKEKEGGAN